MTSDDQGFAGRRCAVVGGGSGIGRAVVEAVEAAGATAAVLDQRLGEAAGPDTRLAVEGDATDAAAVDAFFAEIERRLGGIDIVVHTVGSPCFGALETLSLTAIDDAVSVNLRSALLVSRAAVPALRRSGGGSLVLVASNSGLVARPEDPVYCAVKAGVVMLARSLALTAARSAIRVNVVCPGPVDTPMLHEAWAGLDAADALERTLATVPLGGALGRVATADEVASSVLFLASDQAAYVTGAVLAVDGGKTAGHQVPPP